VITEYQKAAVRRYLLGEASDEECEAIEREYFKDESALSHVESEEEALVEDYLAGHLTVHERDLFEERYLASPVHRRRVEAIRRLSMSARGTWAPHAPKAARALPYQWLALAAALILAVGALWVFSPGTPTRSAQRSADNRSPEASAPARTPPEPSAAPPASPPRVFGFSLPPIQTRGADNVPRLVIPAGTDVVTLQLEGASGRVRPDQMRVDIRTVTGQEVWQGSAAAPADLLSGLLAHADVPAAALPADDYIVTLFETGAGGSERERERYFLRVR
jgi:hypothetical protein